MTDLPSRAQVVIVGGGVIGLSTAFHLAEAGVRDVLVLERATLGSGSTSRAAGGVRAQFSDQVNIELGQRSLAAFEHFTERPGGEIDLHQTGYLFLLDTSESVTTFEASVALQNSLGVPSRMITPAEAAALCGLISTQGMLAAAFSPRDGHCTPEAVVQGYATAARRLGVRIVPYCSVTGLEFTAGAVRSVHTTAGDVGTDAVVCAAGAWSREVGAWAGVDLPVTPLRRQILVTEAVDWLPPRLPMTIDFSSSFYFHPEGDGLLMGMSDPFEQPGFRLDRDDGWLDRLAPVVARRAPSLNNVGVRTGWAGLYEESPDHNGLVGAHPGGLLYATGFSGHGFLMAPAVGEVLRDLYLGRQPVVDVSPLTANRFAASAPRPEQHIV